MDYLTISEINQEDRPRERMSLLGAESLATRELLAIILRSGIKGISSLDLATKILQKFDNNLYLLGAATEGELKSIKGIGTAKASEIMAIFEIAKRMLMYKESKQVKIKSGKDVANYMGMNLSQKRQEEFHILLLDTQNNLMKSVMITKGLLDKTQIHPREVFRPAIQAGCKSVILVHNHPSGETKPSLDDIRTTERLRDVGDLIGVKVLDHIIIGKPQDKEIEETFSSLREMAVVTFN